MSDAYAGGTTGDYVDETAGEGWALFAGVMLLMVGTINVIDGIAATRTPPSSSTTRASSSSTT